MTPQNALQNLFNASRLAPLTAEQHEVLIKSAQLLEEIINPKPEENAKPKVSTK
jgi:hypothetical protein